MWFEDLTPYTYLKTVTIGPPTLNVGWLEAGQPFATGDVPPELIDRLEDLVAHAPTQKTRGSHYCDFCPPVDESEIDWDDPSGWPPSGSAEIRAIGSDGTRYAAPTLVHHYIAIHRYLPPAAFLDAVARNMSIGWGAAREGDLCMSCGTALQRKQMMEGTVQHLSPERLKVVLFACATCGTKYGRSWPASAE